MRNNNKKCFFVTAVLFWLFFSCSFADTLTMEYPHKIENRVALQVHPFELNDVRLLDGPFEEAMDHNAEWLLSLEPDRFLAWFRKEAGLEPKAQVYGGWEKETIAGHSLGHYMSACAMMYAETGQDEFKKRTEYIVDELAACQQASGSGYMSAFPGGKRAFAEIARGEIRSAGFDLNGIWVPWYTQHKLMAGLRDIYHYTGNAKALEVWIKHADWINSIVGNLTDEQWQKMLACEHGGINETFADLYAITGNPAYLQLAEKFYHKAVLDPLSQRENRLTGLHANTQIPKVIGSARIYELTGDKKYQTIADFFWTTVVQHYTYANGGNSADEYFGRPDELASRMHDTTETCNTYNMLKLTRHLFTWNPQAYYMDYYERALLNHILAHQHPTEGGRLVYKGFLDMPAHKNFSSPTESFWCCVGTGMENHTKYADTIYAYAEDSLYVNLFINSELTWRDKGIKVTQKTGIPYDGNVTLSFECKDPTALILKIRKPYWADRVTTVLNGKEKSISVSSDGYLTLNRTFEDGDTLTLNMPLKLHVSTLPDMPNRMAFLYGPTLLAEILAPGQEPPMLVSDDVDSLLSSVDASDELVFNAKMAACRIVDGTLEREDMKLIPLYKIAEQPYTVYMDWFTPAQWERKEAAYLAEHERFERLKAASTDVLYPGRMQPERDHNLISENSNIGEFQGRKWRDAYNGWFEFDMKVRPDEPMDLICTYWGSERGRRLFDILVDGEKIATQELGDNKPKSFFDAVYPLPEGMTKGKEKIRIRLQAHPDNYAGGLFEARTVVRSLYKLTQEGDKPIGSATSPAFGHLEKDYPYQPVPFTAVHFNDIFWAPRLETNRSVTIPYAFEKCKESKRFYNFERAAKILKGEKVDDLSPPGYPFDDTDPYKVLEGASFGLAVKYDSQMDAYLDGLIALIASAQEPDGYLYTTRTINPEHPHDWAGNKRWVNVKELSHELYNMGHLYEATAAHYQATGKRTLLDVALKNADLLCDTFGPGKNKDFPGHQIIEMGLVKLYRITGNPKYLNLAKFFLDTRGPGGSEYNQAHKKVIEQDEAVGHAVRATYMYSGMADVAALTGDQSYIDALGKIWNNMVSKKYYITGGIGALHSGEAFGPNYMLPNMSAYCETCAAIGNVYWNHRMFLLHGDSKYIDVLERTLYNGVLSGVSLDGKTFFYPNPLESKGQYRRSPWFGCACCPSNITRFLASVPGYAYAKKDDMVYVNLFAAGTADIKLSDNQVRIQQETRYPWDGRVKMTVSPEKEGELTVCVRIPGWAVNQPVPSDLYVYRNESDLKTTLKVNGKEIPVDTVKGYVHIARAWKVGDTIDLNLPMPVRQVVANEKVKEDRNRIALERGPVVYCLEGADAEKGHVRNMIYDPETDFDTLFKPDLLGSVQVLTGKMSVVELDENNEREVTSPVDVTAIPYYAWCNRGANEMVVWLPTRKEDAFVQPGPTIASKSIVTASPGSGRPESLVDQVEPRSSHDKDNEFYHWWPNKGTSEWIQFDFDRPTIVSAIEVYWLDDTGFGECKVPQSWKLMVLEGDTWKSVEAEDEYGVKIDAFNRTTFKPVETSAVKIEIQLQDGWSAGVHEVRFE